MKIYNFASLNIDKVYKVEHFVQPGETISSLRLDIFPGGKGFNQTVAAARAGAQVYPIGSVGEEGDIFLEVLQQDRVPLDYLWLTHGVSGHAIIQVNTSGENSIIIHPGSNHELTRVTVDHALAKMERGDIVLLTNEVNEVPYILQAAHAAGMKVVFNPSPIRADIREYPIDVVDVLILNEVEGRCLSGQDDLEGILHELARGCPGRAILLTLGDKGSIYRCGTEQIKQAAFQTQVVDSTAAGDTYTGYFLACLAGGMETGEAMVIASMAASISVSRQGASTSIPYLPEVKKALEALNTLEMAPENLVK